MKNLFGLAIAAAAAAHGYFYFSYGTFDPCVAATYRVINEQQSGIVRGAGALVSGQIESLLRSKGVMACYRTAFTGEMPE